MANPSLINADDFGLGETGCTPCECGIPGACSKEKLPFLQSIDIQSVALLEMVLVNFLIVLVPSVVVYGLLHFFSRKISNVIRSIISLSVGSLPIALLYSNPLDPQITIDIVLIILGSQLITLLVFLLTSIKKREITFFHFFTAFGLITTMTFVIIALLQNLL